jgi:molybdate/tungstate transport system substrate-binding protein
VTLVKDAPNPQGAVKFLEYMLDPEGGLAVLKSMGQPPFVPCRVDSEEVKARLPGDLPQRVEVRN